MPLLVILTPVTIPVNTVRICLADINILYTVNGITGIPSFEFTAWSSSSVLFSIESTSFWKSSSFDSEKPSSIPSSLSEVVSSIRFFTSLCIMGSERLSIALSVASSRFSDSSIKPSKS